jgi:hypothetical protein
LGGGEDFYEAVDFGQFQEADDVFRYARQAECAAGRFEAGEAIYDSAQSGAVDFCNSGEIENHARLLFVQEVVHRLSEAYALNPRLKLTF